MAKNAHVFFFRVIPHGRAKTHKQHSAPQIPGQSREMFVYGFVIMCFCSKICNTFVSLLLKMLRNFSRGKRSMHQHRGTPPLSLSREPVAEQKAAMVVYTMSLGKPGKRAYTIGLERVYTVEALDTDKKRFPLFQVDFLNLGGGGGRNTMLQCFRYLHRFYLRIVSLQEGKVPVKPKQIALHKGGFTIANHCAIVHSKHAANPGEKNNKHQKLFGIVPGMGGCQIRFLCCIFSRK